MHLDNEENIFKYLNGDIQKYLDESMHFMRSKLAECDVDFRWYLPTSCSSSDGNEHILLEVKKENLFCKLPWKGLFINNGERERDIFPDCWCKHPIGNILQDSLLEVWNNTKMQGYRRRIIAADISLCAEDCMREYSAMVKEQLLNAS